MTPSLPGTRSCCSATGGPTVQEWAEALGTIDYELVTRVGARVPRSFTGGAA